MADDWTASASSAKDLEAEVEKSRLTAARLRETMAERIGGKTAISRAADRFRKVAQQAQACSLSTITGAINRTVRERPAASILAGVLVGFLVGRALRRD